MKLFQRRQNGVSQPTPLRAGPQREARSGNTAEPASPGRRCCPLEGLRAAAPSPPARAWPARKSSRLWRPPGCGLHEV